MPLNLAELLSIARGEIDAGNGRNGVARRNATPPATPQKPGITPVTPATPQKIDLGKDDFRGVAEGVAAALRRPPYRPEEHRCSCGTAGIIATGWFLREPGRARWFCAECYRAAEG